MGGMKKSKVVIEALGGEIKRLRRSRAGYRRLLWSSNRRIDEVLAAFKAEAPKAYAKWVRKHNDHVIQGCGESE